MTEHLGPEGWLGILIDENLAAFIENIAGPLIVNSVTHAVRMIDPNCTLNNETNQCVCNGYYSFKFVCNRVDPFLENKIGNIT